MDEKNTINDSSTEQTTLPKARIRYSLWIRLTAIILVVAIILNFLTGVDFSLMRYQGTDQMTAAQYILDTTPYLGQSRLQRLKSLLTGVDSFSINLQAAEIAIGKTEYESAAKFLNKCIPESPDDLQKAELYNRLGCVYMLAEDPVRAQQAFDSSIALNPEEPTSYLLRAQLRYQDADNAGSLEDAVKYLEFGGNDGEMLQTAASLCELGGNLAKAEEAMGRMIQASEDDSAKALSYAERGRIRYLQGKEKEAAMDITRARNLNPASLTGVHYAIVALCEYNAGDYGLASKDFLQAARLSEDGNAEYYEQAILCGYLMSDYAFIAKTIEEASGKNQMTASSYLIQGTLLFSEERYEEAEAALTDSVETGTVVVGAYYYRGLSRLALGDYEKAVEDFSEAVKWEEDIYGCIFNRGVCYYALGDNEAAAADFSNVVENSTDESLILSASELLSAIEYPEKAR